MAGEPIKLTREEVEKWKDSPHKQKVLAEMKKQNSPPVQHSKPAKKWSKKDDDDYYAHEHAKTDRDHKPPVQHTAPKPKTLWERAKERVTGSKDKRQERHKEREPRGRVSSRSVYKDGKLVEKIHYGPAKEPRQPKPRRMPRGDPLGGIGKGLNFSDMLPSNRGYGLGGMMSEPYGAPAPAPRRRRKGSRRQPREQAGGDDYMDRLMAGDYPKPWRGIKW